MQQRHRYVTVGRHADIVEYFHCFDCVVDVQRAGNMLQVAAQMLEIGILENVLVGNRRAA